MTAVPKSTEVIQAQIATFAAEHVEHYEDRAHIFNNLGTLAVRGVHDVTRVTESAEYHNDENGNKNIRIPEGSERIAATADGYTGFLRSVSGSHYEAIQGRTEMLKAYDDFEPKIARLRAGLADPETREQHPDFLGKGSNAKVFLLEDNGVKYAVRVPSGRGVNAAQIDEHLASAVLGNKVPHLERIVAASYKDGVTIAEMMPGKEVSDLTKDEVGKITDEQLVDLVNTLKEANRLGINIDPKPSNIFYDSEYGFGIVDYQSSKLAGHNKQKLSHIIGDMAAVIDNGGFYGRPSNLEATPEDYARDLELQKANLDAIVRYRAVVENNLGGDEQREALAIIDKRIDSAQMGIRNNSDPQWVAERIAQNQEMSRQRAERAKKPPLSGWDILG